MSTTKDSKAAQVSHSAIYDVEAGRSIDTQSEGPGFEQRYSSFPSYMTAAEVIADFGFALALLAASLTIYFMPWFEESKYSMARAFISPAIILALISIYHVLRVIYIKRVYPNGDVAQRGSRASLHRYPSIIALMVLLFGVGAVITAVRLGGNPTYANADLMLTLCIVSLYMLFHLAFAATNKTVLRAAVASM